MTSSYRDPNITAALAYQAEQEQRRKAQEQPSFLDIAGRTALGLGAAALAGVGIARGLRRNDDRFDLNKYRQAARPIVTQDLSANAEETVRRAARATTTPPPSRPAPPAGVARQQAAEEFTRQARAERPVGVSQVNIQDLIEPSFALPQEPLTGTPYSVSEVINLANQTKTKSPQVAERAASTVKLLPPARAQSTDFLRNQLGSRGYIEQSILDRVAEQSAGDLIDEVTAFSNKEARSELARQGASIQSQQRKNLWNLVSEIQNETLVDTQQARTGLNVDQAINALDAAEDQQTGRMKIQLQRNEDLDMSQVEVLEDIASQQRNFMMEQDEPINSVASQLPDGLPVDQAESTGRLGSYTLGRASDADLSQSSAANFLQQRRLKLLEDAEAGTPARLEKKLADAFGPEAWREDPKATRRRNALKLGAAGNEQFFENLNEGTVTIAGEQFPVSSLKEGVYMEDTAQNLLNKGDAYRDWLGNIRLEETRNQIKLANQLDDLLAQDKILQGDTGEVALGAAKKSRFFSSPQERDAYITEERTASRGREITLDLQDEIDGRVNELLRSFEMSEKRLAGAEKATSRNLQRLSVPQKLMSGVEEGIVVRPILTAPDNIPMLEGELSNIERGRPVGQFISQEQLEVVPGGLLSGGRARSVSNIGQDIGFDPETGERIVVPLVDETGERIVQKLAGKRMGADVGVRGRGGVAGLDTKASIGIYGPELAEYGTAAQTKTGQYTQEASQVPSLVNPEPLQKGKSGGYFTYPQQREANPVKYTQEATPERIASVLLSEQVRKGQRSFPQQNIGPYPSSILARPVRINFPEQTIKPSPVQLSLPSDVVPATAAAARVRVTPADQAAQQLEAYMGRLQRGRTSPLTSQVRIQPSLF
jgi:hypothetical protein